MSMIGRYLVTIHTSGGPPVSEVVDKENLKTITTALDAVFSHSQQKFGYCTFGQGTVKTYVPIVSIQSVSIDSRISRVGMHLMRRYAVLLGGISVGMFWGYRQMTSR